MEGAVHESPNAKLVRERDAELAAHHVRVVGDLGAEAARVEGEGVGEVLVDVRQGQVDEAGDAGLVLQEDQLQVRPKRARGGELGQEHQHGQLPLALVPVLLELRGQLQGGGPRDERTRPP